MPGMTNPLLFVASFVGTKFVGLDQTVAFFRSLGRVARRLPSRTKSVETLRRHVARGYSLLPLPIQCLDQAIVTWYTLNANGHPARLKIGVALSPLYSHAWVVSGSEVFGDIARLADFHVVAEYGEFVC